MRLFVALELSDQVGAALAALLSELKLLCHSASWARAEGMHVTLKFIGHVVADGDTEKLDAVRAALAGVKSSAPVGLQYRGIGFFPNARRPRVMWCRVEASANLAPLAADVEKALEPLRIAREARPFVPHLTLARFKAPEDTKALVRAAEEATSREFGSARETEFHLFESKLNPRGAEYRKIESYSFVGTGA
jgi:RNA 2',3'-cyclic 3'-phosphodiesterase